MEKVDALKKARSCPRFNFPETNAFGEKDWRPEFDALTSHGKINTSATTNSRPWFDASADDDKGNAFGKKDWRPEFDALTSHGKINASATTNSRP
jgi:hypothetical protein